MAGTTLANGAAPRQMQMLVTRFERLTRRISLAGLMSGHKAAEAIAAGRVLVDGQVAAANFKVFSEAVVTVDGLEAPPPRPRPRLWALFKPKWVLSQETEKDGSETLRSLLKKRYEKELLRSGRAQCLDLDRETLWDKHFVVVFGLPFTADGLLLMTNDGLFADALRSAESKILTAYDVKITGEPPVDLLHDWRRRAKAGGVDFGQVFVSITKRTGATTKLRVRYVETPNRPLDLLMQQAKMRVLAVQRHSFGPYSGADLPPERCIEIPVHSSLQHLCPKADIRQVLVPSRGSVLDASGLMRQICLQGSAVAPPEEATLDWDAAEDAAAM